MIHKRLESVFECLAPNRKRVIRERERESRVEVHDAMRPLVTCGRSRREVTVDETSRRENNRDGQPETEHRDETVVEFEDDWHTDILDKHETRCRFE